MIYESPAMDYLRNEAYEKDFISGLLEFIKNDALLKNFYDRFVVECENIIKVIEKLEDIAEDIGVFIEPLEKIIDKFVKAEKPKKLAFWYSKFHEKLFQIAGNKATLEMWQQENSLGFSYKIWQSICLDTAHRDRLCKIHSEILEAIKNKDKGKAISAMQEHFSVILIHYTAT